MEVPILDPLHNISISYLILGLRELGFTHKIDAKMRDKITALKEETGTMKN